MKKQYTHARKRYVSGNILEETHLQWSKVSAASKFSQKPINRGPQSAFSADQKPTCLDPQRGLIKTNLLYDLSAMRMR